MSNQSEIGVVVVGLGMAGKIRIKDLQQQTCRLRLKGFVSRRTVESQGAPQMTLEEALDRPDVDAVMICTEPAQHEATVRKSLEKGKHVLVEYPLALTSEKARNLYQLAEDKGLILREENIAMLTQGYLALKGKAASSALTQASFKSTSGFNGWIEGTASSALPFTVGVSGLQVLLSVFGDLQVKSASMQSSEEGFTAAAELETNSGSPITMEIARSKSGTWSKKTSFEFEDGEIVDLSKVSQGKATKGLFMEDMEQFDDNILNGQLPDRLKWVSLRGLELADNIHSLF